jgi:biotin-dependent carboxylase-like uncharacterized protein
VSVLINRAGLLTTVQAKPRVGLRHLGVPLCGPADPLSMALANHLLGNALLAPALEITLSGIDLQFESETAFAMTGAPTDSTLNGRLIEAHRVYVGKSGDKLSIGAAKSGVRVYLAIGGGVAGDSFLGSESTYVPAGFGGFRGRALRDNDRLDVLPAEQVEVGRQTPQKFQPPLTAAWAIRACLGSEFHTLDLADRDALFDTNFSVGTRSDRMGMQLQGKTFKVASTGYLDSAPIFPGCLQCPEDGTPYLLSVDAQTTGGYSQLAQVARVDRHVIGQFRAGDHLRLLQRTPEEAAADLREKHEYWHDWLPDIESVI